MKSKTIYFVIIIALIAAAAVYFINGKPSKEPAGQTENKNQPIVQNMKHFQPKTDPPRAEITIKTNFGEIQFETYDVDAPKTVENFITLANKGFYDGLIFHRVIKGFMIQGGDPNCGSQKDAGMCGAGGPGYRFEDELNSQTESYKAGYTKGTVAMANSGPNTNGSQFFIMLEDYPLPNNYTIFGKVVEGQEVVDKIGDTKTDSGDRPLAPVIMEKVSAEPL